MFKTKYKVMLNLKEDAYEIMVKKWYHISWKSTHILLTHKSSAFQLAFDLENK